LVDSAFMRRPVQRNYDTNVTHRSRGG